MGGEVKAERVIGKMFARERKWGAVLSNAKGYMKKGKDGVEGGAQTKMIKLIVDVPITAKIKGLLDPALATIFSLDGKKGPERDIVANFLDIARVQNQCVLSIYKKQNFSKTAKPVWSHGGAGESTHAFICLKKFINRGDHSVMQFQIDTFFDDKSWIWCGEMMGEGEFVLGFKTLQQELPLDGGDNDTDEDEEETGDLLENAEKQ